MDRPNQIRPAVVVLITVLAPLLGGSTELWAKAVIAIAAGGLLIFLPPRGSWPMLNRVLLAIFAVGLISFLPAALFGSTPWRTDLAKLGVSFPSTLSPQPWLSIESIALLGIGLAWASYLLGLNWNLQTRQKALNWFCIGILGLAVTLTVASAMHQRVPFWPEAMGFGFFPNRNQTGNVLGLAGIMIYATAMQGWQRGRRNWWLWLLSLCVIFWALIVNGSRAGVILFFVGALVWHVWWIASAKEKRFPVLVLVALILFGAVLVWSGPKLVARFTGENADLLSRNGRLSIYHDAWNFFAQSPWSGIGLGNFRSLFSSQRNFFISPTEAIHPESDWLWVTVEMGVLAPLLLLAAIAIWIRGCFPFNPGTLRSTRMAAMICGCLFVVHGVFDVSGHRVGALWPALFLAILAVNPESRANVSRAMTFRVLGAMLILAGGFCLASVAGLPAPTSVTADQLVARAEFENAAGNYSGAVSFADRGLKIAPLNWQFYYQRGLARAALYESRDEIKRDFAVTRYLVPNFPEIALKEGLVWLSAGDEDLAFAVWRESMQRWPENAAVLYTDIFGAIRGNIGLRDRWRELGHLNRQCLPILLRNSTRVEFEIELDRLLTEDPDLASLSPAERKSVFSTWLREGDQLALADALQRHPDWQSVGWNELSNALANAGDYRPAYETVIHYIEHPQLPGFAPNDSPKTLLLRFRMTNNVPTDGLALVQSQMQVNDFDVALLNLKNFSTGEKVPPAVYFLESEIWARKGDWQKAWQAIVKYESAIYREP